MGLVGRILIVILRIVGGSRGLRRQGIFLRVVLSFNLVLVEFWCCFEGMGGDFLDCGGWGVVFG